MKRLALFAAVVLAVAACAKTESKPDSTAAMAAAPAVTDSMRMADSMKMKAAADSQKKADSIAAAAAAKKPGTKKP